MYARAAMFMTPKSAIRITVSLPALRGKKFRKIGYARSAVLIRMLSNRNKRFLLKGSYT